MLNIYYTFMREICVNRIPLLIMYMHFADNRWKNKLIQLSLYTVNVLMLRDYQNYLRTMLLVCVLTHTMVICSS